MTRKGGTWMTRREATGVTRGEATWMTPSFFLDSSGLCCIAIYDGLKIER
ncbi:MAG: hypothetical protein KTV72_01535 [Wolbachia endosymbiont of Melophagus ovinus]|nr:hypothetical protein [Wolbachia endosymbiont of Melophagus ovinus]